MGAGTVGLQFVTDDDPAGIIPDAGKVAEVQANVDTKRPVTADAYVTAPIADALNMTIKLSPNTATVRAAVLAELQDLITRDSVPAGTILISKQRAAVALNRLLEHGGEHRMPGTVGLIDA